MTPHQAKTAGTMPVSNRPKAAAVDDGYFVKNARSGRLGRRRCPLPIRTQEQTKAFGCSRRPAIVVTVVFCERERERERERDKEKERERETDRQTEREREREREIQTDRDRLSNNSLFST